VTQLAEWLERHTERAPVVLRDRVREHALSGAGQSLEGPGGSVGARHASPVAAVTTMPARARHHPLSRVPAPLRPVRGLAMTEQDVLAQAASGALEQVVAQPGDRSVALDLLAADALITLALLAQAESAPERLGDFAASLLRSERPDL
jgi:hypothetical protein